VSEYEDELVTERTMKDRFMAHHAESPFVAEHVDGFSGLRYFPIDEKFCVTAKLERLGVPQEAYLRTNRDGQAVMRYLGDLTFKIGGRSLKLRVYHAGEGIGTSVFAPFRDATSGDDSYGAGRYVTLELNEQDVYQLDFNRAFNPYCAYTDAYECGFPPSENDLPVPVRAGEKVWSGERNPRTPSSAVIALLPKRPVVAVPAKGSTRRKAPRPARIARRPPRAKAPSRASAPSRRPARGRGKSPARSAR
jgi:uncharacterized protein (DUF1684 family)